ncbi:MAG: GtrA family protein [Streptosporangiaceae bacterium]|nr:GtrA family protein [Streptosporangiaceae bacterium]
MPVDWVDDLDSRVDIAATALADLRGIVRLGTGLARGTIKVPSLRAPSLTGGQPVSGGRMPAQIIRFAGIGILSTIAYVVLYLLLRGMLPDQAANAMSLLVTAIGNTAANRRMTFGISGRSHAARHQAKGLIAFVAGLVLTSGALFGLHALSAHPGRFIEVTVLIGANLLATVVRFILFRTWVFGAPRPDPVVAPIRTLRPNTLTAKSKEIA